MPGLYKGVLERKEIDEHKSEYLNILKDYLPKMLSENEIKIWILDNIDINSYSNKMQGMGAIMSGLKGQVGGGNLVKKVLQKL